MTEFRGRSYDRIPEREKLEADVLAMARAQGCTCNPTITVPTPEPGKLVNASVEHDHWCPVVRGAPTA